MTLLWLALYMRFTSHRVKDWNCSKLKALQRAAASGRFHGMVNETETALRAEVKRLIEQRDILAETVRQVRDALAWADVEHPAIGFDELWERIDLATREAFRDAPLSEEFDSEGNPQRADRLR